MENKERLKPLTMEQRKFAEDNYRLIMEFLKKSKLDSEEYFDVAVFGYLLSVEYIWMILITAEMQIRSSFIYVHEKRNVFIFQDTEEKFSYRK